MAKNVLGRGLGALITANPLQPVPSERIVQDDGKSVGVIAKIELSKIVANKKQPRLRFDDTAMEELKNSIKERGVIAPITVRRKEEGYEIIAGERRFRASKSLGLDTIPAYIIDITTDAEMLELALIENVQRQNLDPIEVALGYDQLIQEFNLTQEQVAEKVGKSRTAITNALRLLKLPRRAQDLVQEGKITEGHARALISLHEEEILFIVDEITAVNGDKEYSVRDVEKIVQLINKDKFSSKEAVEFVKYGRAEESEQLVNDNSIVSADQIPSAIESAQENLPVSISHSQQNGQSVHPELEVVRSILDKDFSQSESESEPSPVQAISQEQALPDPVKIHIADVEDKLRYRFGTQTRVRMKADGSGAFEIVFANEDELDRILELLLSEQHQLS